MLQRAADPGGEVDLGLDRLARLSDLVAVRDPPGIDGRAGGADGRAADLVRQLVEDRERVRPTQPSPSGQHDLRVFEPGPARRLFVALDDPRPSDLLRHIGFQRHDPCGSPGRFGDDALRPQQDQRRGRSRELDVDDLRAAEDLRARVARIRDARSVAHEGRPGAALEPPGDVT